MDHPNVLVIIPVGPAHTALVQRAIRSAEQQTYPCNIIVIEDRNGHGAGWARNEGAKLSDADFFVFLDADDTIDRDFVSKTLISFAKSGRYVYTDWQRHVNANGTRNVETVKTPDYSTDTLFQHAYFHSVTTLLPAVFWREVGGFDEGLPAWEDNDFYYKLAHAGFCGQRLPLSLFHYYSDDGTRRQIGYRLRDELWTLLRKRYDMAIKRGCCGGSAPPMQTNRRPKWPISWQDADAVEAEFIRGGSLAFSGLATRTRYPRTSKGQRIWVHKADGEAEHNRPGGGYFRVLEAPPRNVQDALSRLQEKVKNELS